VGEELAREAGCGFTTLDVADEDSFRAALVDAEARSGRSTCWS